MPFPLSVASLPLRAAHRYTFRYRSHSDRVACDPTNVLTQYSPEEHAWQVVITSMPGQSFKCEAVFQATESVRAIWAAKVL